MPKGLDAELPLRRSENDGYYKLIKEYDELVVQDFKNLLLTVPGERVMNPDFGVGLKQFLFEQNDPANRGRLATRIQSQTNKYLPFIEIEDLRIGSPENSFGSPRGHVIYLEIEIFIKPLDENLVVPLSINKEQ